MGRLGNLRKRSSDLGSSLALAALEILVNLDLPGHLLPRDHVAMRVELPDDLAVTEVDRAALPADWRLKVPSAVVPLEHNLLLNPANPEAARLPPPVVRDFSFDPRILALLDSAFG